MCPFPLSLSIVGVGVGLLSVLSFPIKKTSDVYISLEYPHVFINGKASLVAIMGQMQGAGGGFPPSLAANES